MTASWRTFVQILVALLLSSCVQANLLRLISVPIVFSRPDNSTAGVDPPAADHDVKDSSIVQVGGFVGAEIGPQQRAANGTTRPCSQSAKFTLQVSQLVGTPTTLTDTVVQSTVFGTRTTAQAKSIKTITVTVDETVTGITASAKSPCTGNARPSTSTALTFATSRLSSPTSTITIEVGTAKSASLSALNPSTTANIVVVTVTSMLRTTSTLLSGAATTYISKPSSSFTTSTVRPTSLATGSNSTVVFTLASQTTSARPAMQTTNAAIGRSLWMNGLAVLPFILIARCLSSVC